MTVYVFLSCSFVFVSHTAFLGCGRREEQGRSGPTWACCGCSFATNVNSAGILKYTFFVSFYLMFDHCSSENSKLLHWAKRFDKFHHSSAYLQNRLETRSSMVTVISALCITFGICKTVSLIAGSFRHCTYCFVYVPPRINIGHNTTCKTKCSLLYFL